MARAPFGLLSVLPLLLAAVLVACGGGSEPPASEPTACALLEPADGAYFGMNLDWDNDSPSSVSERLGRTPAVYVIFASFPMDDQASASVDAAADQVLAANGMLMLTLEPQSLDSVTDVSAADLADRLAAYNGRGLPVFLRFAHEMNGSWYAWSQQPDAYVRAFRQIADEVHARATQTAMMWAPNYGGGYPFAGGQYEAKSGSGAFALLDTNRDGALSMLDDPYAPYYPGDDVVDWVGMSLYHWGSAYPWGENEFPESHKFADQLTGNYAGANGDDRSLPDFYATYAEEHLKPLAITETAALFAPDAGGAPGPEIKRLWWEQVFSPETMQRFPKLEMINWFEHVKFETEINGTVDWSITRDPALAASFRDALPPQMRFAGQAAACG